MNLRGSGGAATTLSMAAAVGAAEGASILYYMFTPWFLSPGDRALYPSVGFNLILFLLINRIVEKSAWPLRTLNDVMQLSVMMTLVYVTVQAPYVVSNFNPLSYVNMVGPAAHTCVQIGVMTLVMWYFKNKK